MPTTKPRLLITLEPRHHRALRMLAGSRGVSMARLVTQMLEPALEALVPFAELAIKGDQLDLVEHLATLGEDLNQTLVRASQSVDAMLRVSRARGSSEVPVGALASPVADPGGGGASPASKPRSGRQAPPPEGGSEASDPRMVITGVTRRPAHG